MATTLVACSNFGECSFADGTPRWGELTAACPNCGKSLASPHRLNLGQEGSAVREGDECLLSVNIEKIAGCARPLQVSLEWDGISRGEPIQVGGGQKNYTFDL